MEGSKGLPYTAHPDTILFQIYPYICQYGSPPSPWVGYGLGIQPTPPIRQNARKNVWK